MRWMGLCERLPRVSGFLAAAQQPSLARALELQTSAVSQSCLCARACRCGDGVASCVSAWRLEPFVCLPAAHRVDFTYTLGGARRVARSQVCATLDVGRGVVNGRLRADARRVGIAIGICGS